MAKTGETRKTKQPLNIDRLPSEVTDAIMYLRNQKGLTWLEIESRSAEKFKANWKTDGGGFVNWPSLPPAVLRLFPAKKLPKSNLQRWWDIRVEQVSANVERMAVQAREISKVFAKTVGAGDKDAVAAAARDIILGGLAEDGSPESRQKIANMLVSLLGVMEQGVANKIRERTVAAGERKLRLLEQREQLAIQKLQRETERLAKKARSGQPITDEELLAVRERTFGF